MSLDTRKLLSLLLAAVLVAGQWAGQLHGLSHAKHDLVVAEYAVDGHQDQAPPLDHDRDHCVAFLAIGASLSAPPSVFPAFCLPSVAVQQRTHSFFSFTRVPFSSRAPPALLS